MPAALVHGYHDEEALARGVAEAVARVPGRATVTEVGRSVEGRPLHQVLVATGPGPDTPRPLAMVIATIHGCEVVASELALRLVEQATEPTPAPDVQELLDVADLAVVPVVNPDGRAAALRSLGRRGPVALAPRRNARGVDLNRNWPWLDGVEDHWTPLSGTSRVRSPWFRGRAPLSEPETRALADLVDRRPPAVLLNLHSTGQIVTYPWSARPEPSPQVHRLRAVAEAFVSAQRGVRYRTKQSNAWYPIVGASNDWFHDAHGTLALTVELGVPGGAVREDPRRAGRFFWWANPSDPEVHVARDAPACIAALRVGVELAGST